MSRDDLAWIPNLIPSLFDCPAYNEDDDLLGLDYAVMCESDLMEVSYHTTVIKRYKLSDIIRKKTK